MSPEAKTHRARGLAIDVQQVTEVGHQRCAAFGAQYIRLGGCADASLAVAPDREFPGHEKRAAPAYAALPEDDALADFKARHGVAVPMRRDASTSTADDSAE